jgi:subtilisin family serine protease
LRRSAAFGAFPQASPRKVDRAAGVTPDVKRTATALVAATAVLVLNATGALAATSYPNDYFFVTNDDQWALTGTAASINAPAAWCASTGLNITVADVDTGANFSHPDLSGKLIAGAAFLGGNTTESSPSGTGQAAVSDDNGHGSMTTGIMVANTNNGQGIAAVAPDAHALIVKVLGSDGTGYPNDVAAGIRYAADYTGVRVINVSIGPGEIVSGSGIAASAGDAVTQAIQYASSKGVAVALAAGNSAIPTADYVTLRQNSQAVVVGALGPGDTVASYSNYGYGITVYAPGGDVPSGGSGSLSNEIVSTWIDRNGFDYAVGEGTSFATPQVAGVLADLIGAGMSASQAIQTLTSHTATSSDGVPQLDAAAALNRSKSELCGSPSTGGTIAPPGGGVIGSGGKPISATPTPRPAPPPTRAAATNPPAAIAAAPTPTPVATADATGGAAANGGALGTEQGGRAAPPAEASPEHGGANPLLLALLGVVIIAGAPVTMWLRRPRRPV